MSYPLFTAARTGAVGLALCLLAACSRQEAPPEPVRAVKLQTVGAAPLVAKAEFAGDIRARTEAQLGFRVAGKVLSRNVELGQTVKPGQLLAQLDGADYALAAQGAQAQVQAATTQRDLAAANYHRFKELRDKNFISAAEMERHAASLKSAQAQLDQAKANAAAQGNQTAYTRLVADVAGVVTAVNVEPGQVVAAGAPVLRIAKDGARDAVFAVPEDRIAQTKTGQPVQLKVWPDEELLTAHIREVAASADAATRTYQVKATLDAADPERLPKLGATVTVIPQGLQGDASPAAQAIKLPLAALWEKAGKSQVWVFDAASSSVQPQAVGVARIDGNEAVIQSGLKAGQQVVIAGVHVLSAGQKVTVFQSKYDKTQDPQAAAAGNSVVAGDAAAAAAKP
ncbi:efflux RND transporter periplasmic adaptor subunit [Comamonas sp. J-3]|uniref:efflux RND transporter periplasmic adaptor subunit n=1 Tax=Comamonas trifloxystrobinivorans TaxID=3350256 RepID=UPI003726F0DA